ncbi:MAG: O-antigen ligase family protein, partial [Anaerolineales bacterium]|nr:O-antigen ligase family protein [Anaerolineales bacterium]
YITTVTVAAGLEPGIHTVRLVADRGWEQWALRGFAVGYRPVASQPGPADWSLGLLALFSIMGLIVTIPRAGWPAWLAARSSWFRRLSNRLQLLLTALLGAIAALAGWLTWGQQAAGLYRRAGDLSQLTLTATAAAVFYVAPSFYIYMAALLLLFVLLYLRPAWGFALVAFSLPLYVLPKAMLGYRFSPVEFFILLAFLAALAHWLTIPAARHRLRWRRADGAVLAFLVIATASLWFTERLDVATNEWRVVILEPLLIYAAFRLIRPDERERAHILDGLVASGLMIALIGLGQYLTGQNLITAEGGLLRLRSIYGSPNNVALYFERILPFTLAFALVGHGWRRRAYGSATLVLGLAGLLTFSKGGLLLGFPVAIGVVLLLWLKGRGRRVWPWLLAGLVVGPAGLLVVQQIPALSGRLDILGVTSDFRVNLWQASLNMIRENPWWGVGLDNFLYAYRGRYILQAAWQEPNLNHPHNIILDYWTRLGIFGLLSGLWLWAELAGTAWRRWRATPAHPFALGLAGAVAAMLAHGLVDQSYFLVDLAGAFCLLLGLASSEN